MNFVNLAKNHKTAIFLAIIAAMIIASPQLFFRWNNQDVYRGIEVMGVSDDEISFLVRVREVQDGHPFLSNAYFKEGKDGPYLFPPLGSIIVGSLGRIFRLDINNTILFSRIFFTFIVFLLIYGFVIMLSKNKLAALTSSTGIILGSILLSRYGLLAMLGGRSPKTNFLLFMRPVNPLMTLFFFFSFLLFFLLFLNASGTRKRWIFGGISALLLGLSFYDYLYTWTFLYTFCGLLALFFIFRKKWQDAKRIIIIIFGSILVAIPYLWNIYKASIYTNPTLIEISQRHGLIEPTGFVIGFLVPTVLAFFLLFFPRQDKERYFFSLAVLLTPFIVLNQHLVTGKAIVAAHYHWYYHTPLAIIFLLVIFFAAIPQRWHLFKKASAIFAILLSVYTGILIQNTSYAAKRDYFIENQKYAPALEWLNKNAQKEEVVFASADLSEFIVIYTPLNVFHQKTVSISFAATKERLLETLFLLYRLNGVDADAAQKIFFEDRVKISWSLYGAYYREALGSYAAIPDEVIRGIIRQYQDSLSSISTDDFLNKTWDKYGVKYFIWDKTQNPRWELGQYRFLRELVDLGDFLIYQRN